MNSQSPQYAGDLTPDEIADVLAKSCGHLGTGAEYLLNTVTQLEARGMHDPGLWHLQELVAARIGAV
jgi:cation transport protein ChaC